MAKSRKRKPTDAQIKKKAYELWEAAGKPEGNDGQSYWYEAETQLTSDDETDD